MKKIFKILFRIFYITLFSAVLLAVIYVLLPKVWGDVAVQVAGESYVPETVSGYYELDEALNLNYRTKGETGKFSHIKGNYGMYDYIIPIHDESIDTELTIHFFKTNQWKMRSLNISVVVYEENGVWNADVVVETADRVYEETFRDIEENVIEIRVE